MISLPDGITVEPGRTITLEPDGHHLMLEQLQGSLVEGQRVPVTLRFDRMEEITVEFTVEFFDGPQGAHHH